MGQISKRQLSILFINILIPTAHVQVLLATIKESKQDASIAVLMGYVVAVLIAVLCVELIKRYPNKSILDFSIEILGQPLGKLINLVLILYSILIATYMLKQFATLITTMVYRGTSKYVFIIGLMILVFYIISLGAEVIFRVSDIIFIAVIIVTIVIGGGLVKFLNFNLISPIFNQEITSLIKGAIAPVAFLNQIIIFLFFHHLVNDLSGIARHIQFSLLGGMLLVIGFVIADLAVFGSDLGSILLFPPYMLIRYINIEAVLDRVEILMLNTWTALSFLEITAYFWISSQALIKLFNLSKKRKAIINLPLVVICIALVDIQWEGISDFQEYSRGAYTIFLLLIEITIPLLLYIVALFRNKRGDN